MAFRFIFWLFGIFCPVLVRCSKKNLATLAGAAEAMIRKIFGKTKKSFFSLFKRMTTS
jgi:hypothetical protein